MSSQADDWTLTISAGGWVDGGTVSIRQELEWWDMCDSGTAIVIMMSFKQALERCNIQDSGAFIVIMMFIRTVTFHGFPV